MHIENNVFDNVFNTVMEAEGKTKDTFKSREELNEHCRPPELAHNVTTENILKLVTLWTSRGNKPCVNGSKSFDSLMDMLQTWQDV